jgi:hypothetical protein
MLPGSRTHATTMPPRLAFGLRTRKRRCTLTSANSERGGSSVGQSSGLIIRRSQVRSLPAPRTYLQLCLRAADVGSSCCHSCCHHRRKGPIERIRRRTSAPTASGRIRPTDPLGCSDRPAPGSRAATKWRASSQLLVIVTYARPMPQSGALSHCRGLSVTLRRPLPSSFITYTSEFCCSPSTIGVSAETI